MVNYFYRTTKHPEFEELEKPKPGVWVHLEDPTTDELREIADNEKLNFGVLLDALDDDEMPRLEREDKVNYVFTRFVDVNDQLEASTEVILLVISDKKFITITSKHLPNFESLLDDKGEVYTTQRTKLFLQVLQLVVDSYDSQLTKVGRQVKSIRQRLRVEDIKNKDFIDFVALEEELNEFLTVLTPTSAVLKRLLVGKHVELFESDADIVEDLNLSTEQSIAESKAILRSIVNIREAYATIATNNLNRIIRILTVLTTILAVPTLIASIYGMNIALPFDGRGDAFTIVMLFSLFVSLILLLIFRWNKWL